MLKDHPSQGISTSPDMESLFTNVPVAEITELVLERVFRRDHDKKIHIPEESKKLLQICTKKAPFTNHRGHMY